MHAQQQRCQAKRRPEAQHSQLEQHRLILLSGARLHLLQLHHWLELGRALGLGVGAVLLAVRIAARRGRRRAGGGADAGEACEAAASAKGAGRAEDRRDGLRIGAKMLKGSEWWCSAAVIAASTRVGHPLRAGECCDAL